MEGALKGARGAGRAVAVAGREAGRAAGMVAAGARENPGTLVVVFGAGYVISERRDEVCGVVDRSW